MGLSSLFDKLPGVTDNKITKIDTMNADQKAMMSSLGQYLSQNVGKGATPYTGDLSAGINPAELAALNKATSNLNSGLSDTDKSSIASYLNLISQSNPDTVFNNYMKYNAPSEAAYLKNTTLPTIKENMVSGGTLRGTGTERAISSAVSDFGNQQLSRIATAIQDGQTNALQALGLSGQINDLENQTSEMQMASTIGGIARQIKQDDLTRQFEEFKRTSPEMSPLIDKILGYMNIQTQSAILEPGTKNAVIASNVSKLTPFI